MTHRYSNVPTACISDIVVGTTTDDYVPVLSLKTLPYAVENITIHNTASANALTVAVDGYVDESSTVSFPILHATSILAADSFQIDNTTIYGKIIVSVKSTVDDAPATFQIDYAMQSAIR